MSNVNTLLMYWLTLSRYSFCRVADDLVDNSRMESEALLWIKKLTNYLDLVYGSDGQLASSTLSMHDFVEENFPEAVRPALELLPTRILPSKPFYDLIEGFKMDLSYINHKSRDNQFPIKDETDLELYARRVASTVGELCLRLVFHHSKTKFSNDEESILVVAAHTMGCALQYVNIARDILIDAEMRRVYLPTDWLKQEGLTPQDIISHPNQPKVEKLRQRLLDKAFEEYGQSRSAMRMLPSEVRGPLIVAVESYMEIGRVLRERTDNSRQTRKGRATVPLFRRVWVAWKSLIAE